MTMSQTKERVEDIPALTGLRFLAAVYVILFHSWPVFMPSQPGPVYWNQFLSLGYIAVSFFFVLSGFILTTVYLKGERSAPFDRKLFRQARFARIYPIYVLSLLVSAPFVVAAMTKHGGVYRIAKMLFLAISNGALLQAWHPVLSGNWNRPTWSVSVEAFFYLAFPVVGAWIMRRKAHLGSILFASWLFSVASSSLCVFFMRHSTPSLPHLELFLFNPVLRLPEFMIGICFAALPRIKNVARFHGMVRAGSLAALLLVPLLVKLPWLLVSNGLLAPLFGAIILHVSTSQGLLVKGLKAAPIVRLGHASFSMYLLHLPILFWMMAFQRSGPIEARLNNSGPFQANSPGFFFIYWILVLSASLCSYSFIENPARRVVKRWFLKSYRRAGVIPAEA